MLHLVAPRAHSRMPFTRSVYDQPPFPLSLGNQKRCQSGKGVYFMTLGTHSGQAVGLRAVTTVQALYVLKGILGKPPDPPVWAPGM